MGIITYPLVLRYRKDILTSLEREREREREGEGGEREREKEREREECGGRRKENKRERHLNNNSPYYSGIYIY